MNATFERRLLTASAISAGAAVLSGVIIASNGGHLACSAWPICLDELSMNSSGHVWLALLHRLLVLLTGLTTLVAVVRAWRRPTDSLIRSSVTIAALLIGLQALLGALFSSERSRAVADLTHLSGALLTVGALTIATTAAWIDAPRARLAERRRRLVDLAWWSAAAGAVMVLVVGARGIQTLDVQVQALMPANALGTTIFALGLSTALAWQVGKTPGVARVSRWMTLFGVIGSLVVLAGLTLGAGSRIPAVSGAVIAWVAGLAATVMLGRIPSSRAVERTVTQPAAPVAWRLIIADYISLTKPKVISLLLVTTLAAMYLTEAGMPSWWTIFWTMIGGYLAAGGAGAINCAVDSDIDVNMGRTSRRPVPSGRISARAAFIFGLVLSLLSLIVLAVFTTPAAALAALAGIVYYAYFYTSLLKRSTWQNIIIGGGAGAIPPLVGWTAMTGSISVAAVILFAIIFYWTPPHFWALALVKQQDYARAGVPMLPVVAGDGETRYQIFVYSVLMVAVTLLPTAVGSLSWVYLIGALALGAKFLQDAWAVWRKGDQTAIWQLYKYSLLYLALLFAVMVADRLVLGQAFR